VFIEPSQFGKARKVFDGVVVGLVKASGDNPPNMTPPKTLQGRMRVSLGIGVPVMVTVMRRPYVKVSLSKLAYHGTTVGHAGVPEDVHADLPTIAGLTVV
jgi:hypothetical protein